MNERRDPALLSRSNRALDAANFFLADVRDGLGPYLAIYLLTVQHWDEASIGVVMSIATAAGIIAQTPAGALVDALTAKRVLVAAAALLVTATSLTLPWLAAFIPVAATQAAAHAAAAVFGPALAAITLGIFGHKAFTARIGRNESFNHAGNAVAAGLAGILAYFFGPTVVFYLLAASSAASLVSVLAIPARAIDYDLARGLHDKEGAGEGSGADAAPSGFRVLMTCRPLLIFACCVVLFHLANAAMLPLVGGFVVVHAGYSAAFLTLAAVAATGVLLFGFAMPETKSANTDRAAGDTQKGQWLKLSPSSNIAAAE